MTLLELHSIITAIYRCGYEDCLEGRKFDPQIPEWFKSVQARGENASTVPSDAPQEMSRRLDETLSEM